jgi:hypothetical protein
MPRLQIVVVGSNVFGEIKVTNQEGKVHFSETQDFRISSIDENVRLVSSIDVWKSIDGLKWNARINHLLGNQSFIDHVKLGIKCTIRRG